MENFGREKGNWRVKCSCHDELSIDNKKLWTRHVDVACL